MEFYIPRIGDSKVKDKIIELLIQESSLTLREICRDISKKNSVTYQAVHKAIRELSDKRILAKENIKYKINRSWIEKLRKFTAQMEFDEKEIIEKVEKIGLAQLTFNSQLSFGKFLLSFVSRFQKKDERENLIINSKHIYNMWWLTEIELLKFREWENFNLFILSDVDSEVDRWLAKVWEGIGTKVSFGAENCKTYDFITIGDIILEIHWNIQTKEDWEKQRGPITLKQYDVIKGIQHITATDKPMSVLIFKDPAL